jgi:anti-sigma regulatory factor (Ser/Thr protein kinase)
MPPSEITLVLAPRKDDVGAVRRSLRELLSHHHIPPTVANDVVLSAQEACNNVIVHSRCSDGIEITARCLDHRVYVEVRDRGHGFDVTRMRPKRTPDPLCPRGRGLFIIHSLMDDVEVRSDSDGTIVRMWKRTRTA